MIEVRDETNELKKKVKNLKLNENEIIIIKEIKIVNKNDYYYKNREEKINYQKEYNKKQSEKIKEYNKTYYEQNKERILDKAKTIVLCECGQEVKLFNLNSHKKTKKHEKQCLLKKNEFNSN